MRCSFPRLKLWVHLLEEWCIERIEIIPQLNLNGISILGCHSERPKGVTLASALQVQVRIPRKAAETLRFTNIVPDLYFEASG